MATTSSTTYTHTCDLCGEEREKQHLRQLFGNQFVMGMKEPHQVADICTGCRNRPIGDLIALFDKKP